MGTPRAAKYPGLIEFMKGLTYSPGAGTWPSTVTELSHSLSWIPTEAAHLGHPGKGRISSLSWV
jgi:hypothetical protein